MTFNNPRFFTEDMLNYSFIWDNCTDVMQSIELYVYYADNKKNFLCINKNQPIFITYGEQVNLKHIYNLCQMNNIDMFSDSISFKFQLKEKNSGKTIGYSTPLFPQESINLRPQIMNISATMTKEKNVFQISGDNAVLVNFFNTINNPITSYNLYIAQKTEDDELLWNQVDSFFIDNSKQFPLFFRVLKQLELLLDTEYYIMVDYNLKNDEKQFDFLNNYKSFLIQDIVKTKKDKITLHDIARNDTQNHRALIKSIENMQYVYFDDTVKTVNEFIIETGKVIDNFFVVHDRLTKPKTVYKTHGAHDIRYTIGPKAYANTVLHPCFYTEPVTQTFSLNNIATIQTVSEFPHSFDSFIDLNSLSAQYDEENHLYKCQYKKTILEDLKLQYNDLYFYQKFNGVYKLCNILFNDLTIKQKALYHEGVRFFNFLDPDFLTGNNTIDSYEIITSDYPVVNHEQEIIVDNISQEQLDDVVLGLNGYEYKCSLYKIANYETVEHPEGKFTRKFLWDKMLIQQDEKTGLPRLYVRGTETNSSEKDNKIENSYVFSISIPSFPLYNQDFPFNCKISKKQEKEIPHEDPGSGIQEAQNIQEEQEEEQIIGGEYGELGEQGVQELLQTGQTVQEKQEETEEQEKEEERFFKEWLLQTPSLNFINAEQGYLLEDFVSNSNHVENTEYKVILKVFSANKKRYDIIYEDYIPYQTTHFLKGISYNYYPYGQNQQTQEFIVSNFTEVNTYNYDKIIFNFHNNHYFDEKRIFTSPSTIETKFLDKIIINEIMGMNIDNGTIIASFEEDFSNSFEINKAKQEIETSAYDYLYIKYKRNYGVPSVVLTYQAYVNDKFLHGTLVNKQKLQNGEDFIFNTKQICYNNKKVEYNIKNIDKISYEINSQEASFLNLYYNLNYIDFYDSYPDKPNRNFGVSITINNNTENEVPYLLYDDSEDNLHTLYFGYNKYAKNNIDDTVGLKNYDINITDNVVSKVSIFPKNSSLQTNINEEKIWLTFKITEMIQQNCIQDNITPKFSIIAGSDEYENKWENNKKIINFSSMNEFQDAEICIDFNTQVCVNSIQNLYANCEKLIIKDEKDYIWYSGTNLSNELIIFNNQKIKCKKLYFFIENGEISSTDLQIFLLEKAINDVDLNKGLRNRLFKTENIRLFLNTGNNLDYEQYIQNGQEIQGQVLDNSKPVNFYIEKFSDLINDTFGDLIYKLDIIKTEHILFNTHPNDDNIIVLTQENKNKKQFIKKFNINSYTDKLNITNSKIKKIKFNKCQQNTLVNCFLEKEDGKE